MRVVQPKAAKVRQEGSADCALFVGDSQMRLYGLGDTFSLRTRRSGVRISQGAPEIINKYTAPNDVSFGAVFAESGGSTAGLPARI